MCRKTLNGADGKLDRYYAQAYQVIGRSNIVLEKIAEVGDDVYAADSDLDDYHRGEALFLRSLMYFNLWNIFGTAPLITERITALDDAYPPNSTGTELLDQAIADLTGDGALNFFDVAAFVDAFLAGCS